MSCIHERNPLAGFVGQHRKFCGIAGCDEDAEQHVSLGYWCANVCGEHAKHYRSKYKDCELTDRIQVTEEELV